MRSRIIYLLVFLCVFLDIQSLQAQEIINPHLTVDEQTVYGQENQPVQNNDIVSMLRDIEVDTIKLEKGRNDVSGAYSSLSLFLCLYYSYL